MRSIQNMNIGKYGLRTLVDQGRDWLWLVEAVGIGQGSKIENSNVW
jgi:hypothetical protein